MLSAERRAELSLQRKIGIRKKVLRSYVKNRGINSSPSGVKLFEGQTLLTGEGRNRWQWAVGSENSWQLAVGS